MTKAAHRNASSLLAALLLSAVSACSGTPAPDLLGGGVTSDGGPNADGTGGGADATSAGDGGGAAPDASVGDDAPVAPPPAVDAAVGPPDAGTGVPVDAAAAQDSGTVVTDSGPPAATVSCGNATCMAPAEFCCVTFNQGGQQEACATDPGSCMGQGGSAVECTTSAQCGAGQFCCGTKPNSNSYSDVSCQASPCGSGGADQIQFCDPQGPNDCPPGAPRCQQSTILNGFFICQ
jgi:hypothetical protein